MKPTLVLLSVLVFLATGTEASGIFKYFLCGGRSSDIQQHQPKCKKGQVIPCTNHNDDAETIGCTPANSDRSAIHIDFDDEEHKCAFDGNELTSKKKKKRSAGKSTRVVPGYDFEEDDLDVPLNKYSIFKPCEYESGSDYEEESSIHIHELKKLLDGSGVHINDLGISEAGASELLKIKVPLIILLSPEKRVELMNYELEQREEFRFSSCRRRHRPNFRFNLEISRCLNDVKTLKDFLIVVVKFYRRCYADLLLDKCMKAIIAANVFSIEELTDVFEMSYKDLFDFACENGFDSLALELAERIPNQKVNLREAAINAFNNGNDELSGKLLDLHRDMFGDDWNSDFHNVLSEIADGQLNA